MNGYNDSLGMCMGNENWLVWIIGFIILAIFTVMVIQLINKKNKLKQSGKIPPLRCIKR